MGIKIHTSSAVLQLERFLKDKPSGNQFTFDELSKEAGRDIKKDRFIIASVMRILTRHHDRVLRSVRGVGYEICRTEDITGVSEAFRKSAKNKVVRACEVLDTVDISKLSTSDLARYLKEQAKAGTMLTICKAIDNKKLLKNEDSLSIPTEGSILALIMNKSI